MSTELARWDEQEVVGSEPTLEELAATAWDEHLATEGALVSALGHAIGCGRALIAARVRVGEGGWFDWLNENFGPDHYSTQDSRVSVACFYLRVAHNAEELTAANLGSMQHMRRYMRDKRLPGPWTGYRNPDRKMSEELIAEARALCASGMTMEEAGRVMGVSKATIHRYVTPGAIEKQRAAVRRSQQKRRNAVRLARELEARTAARRLKGARHEAYAMAERFQDVIAQAHDESTDSQARREWAMAGEYYRKMRDAIVRAVGADG